MNNGTTMKEVKQGAGLGMGVVLLPLVLLIGKITGSLLRATLWVGGLAFVAGLGAYFATRPDEEEMN